MFEAQKKRFVNATELENKFQKITQSYKGTLAAIAYNSALETIKEAPTIDAVEVVRCAQCRYSKELDRSDPMENRYVEGCLWCEYHGTGELPDEYCSDGERRCKE